MVTSKTTTTTTTTIWRAKQKTFALLGAEIYYLALQIELHSNELLGVY